MSVLILTIHIANQYYLLMVLTNYVHNAIKYYLHIMKTACQLTAFFFTTAYRKGSNSIVIRIKLHILCLLSLIRAVDRFMMLVCNARVMNTAIATVLIMT